MLDQSEARELVNELFGRSNLNSHKIKNIKNVLRLIIIKKNSMHYDIIHTHCMHFITRYSRGKDGQDLSLGGDGCARWRLRRHPLPP